MSKQRRMQGNSEYEGYHSVEHDEATSCKLGMPCVPVPITPESNPHISTGLWCACGRREDDPVHVRRHPYAAQRNATDVCIFRGCGKPAFDSIHAIERHQFEDYGSGGSCFRCSLPHTDSIHQQTAPAKPRQIMRCTDPFWGLPDHYRNEDCEKNGCVPVEPKPRRWLVEFPEAPQADHDLSDAGVFMGGVRVRFIREVKPITWAQIDLISMRLVRPIGLVREMCRELGIEVEE